MEDEAKAPLLSKDEKRSGYFGSSSHNHEALQAHGAAPKVAIDPVPLRKLQVYRRRFYILFIFSLFAASQVAVWNTFGPISSVVEDMFDWNDGTIALLSNWGPIGSVISAVFFSWLMLVKGLRKSILLSMALIVAGAGLRCITTESPFATWLAHGGQLLNGLAGPVASAGPPVISSLWFPAGQRTTATGFVMFIGGISLGGSYLLGPYLVPERNITIRFNTSVDRSVQQNMTATRIEAEKKDFIKYMYIEAGFCCFVFLLLLLYFPDKPPHSPSMSAALSRDSFAVGFKNLAKKAEFRNIALVFGLTIGVPNLWGSVLDVNLKPHGISQTEAGWVGFYARIAACVGSLAIGRFSDHFLHYMRYITLALNVVSLACYIWFALALNGTLPLSSVTLYLSVILAFLMAGASIPMLFEMASEFAFPVAEESAGIVISLTNALGGLVFACMLMIPNIGTAWMTWFVVGAVGAAVPLLAITRDKYNRLSVDENSPLSLSLPGKPGPGHEDSGRLQYTNV